MFGSSITEVALFLPIVFCLVAHSFILLLMIFIQIVYLNGIFWVSPWEEVLWNLSSSSNDFNTFNIWPYDFLFYRMNYPVQLCLSWYWNCLLFGQWDFLPVGFCFLLTYFHHNFLLSGCLFHCAFSVFHLISWFSTSDLLAH